MCILAITWGISDFSTVFVLSYITVVGEKSMREKEKKKKTKHQNLLVTWDLDECSHFEVLFRISAVFLLFTQKKQRALVVWG